MKSPHRPPFVPDWSKHGLGTEIAGASVLYGMASLISDIHYSCRRLMKSPGFSLIAILVLTLGLGVNTTIFTLTNALVLRPLPVEDPENLRWISWQGQLQNITARGWMAEDPAGYQSSIFPHSIFKTFQKRLSEATTISGLHRIQNYTVRAHDAPQIANGFLVSGNFFANLGIAAARGRTLNETDDSLNTDPVVAISHRFWHQMFNGDPDIIGQSLEIEGQPFSIVGILPAGFHGPIRGYHAEFYLPFAALPVLKEWPNLDDPGCWFMEMLVRLPNNATENNTANALQSILNAETDPKYLKNPNQSLQLTLHNGSTGLRYSSTPISAPLRPLTAIAVITLLVACANFAALMLVRGIHRQHQTAVEAALGASPWQLVRRPLIESLIIAMIGAGFALLLASYTKTILVKLLWPQGLPAALGSDLKVYAFSFIIALLAGTVSSLVPAWIDSRSNALDSLRSKTAQALPRSHLGGTLVAIQVALTFLLLIEAGLFAQSHDALQRVDPGFATQQLHTFSINAEGAGYEAKQRMPFYAELQSQLSTLPGVANVGLSSNRLISNSSNAILVRSPFSVANPEREISARSIQIDDAFLETLSIPVIDGRPFGSIDREGTDNVVIVNQHMARLAFGDGPAIGKNLQIGENDFRVIGICRNFKYEDLRTDQAICLFPYQQYPSGNHRMTFYLRSSVTSSTLAQQLRKTLDEINPSVPIMDFKPVETQISEVTAPERTSAYASFALSSLALLLSCLGIYGLVAYVVSRRSAEIGVRMALGATRSNIAIEVLHNIALTLLIGMIAGIAAAFALLPLIQDRLFQIETIDWRILTGAAAFLLGAGALASMFPTLRATRIDPMSTLKAS